MLVPQAVRQKSHDIHAQYRVIKYLGKAMICIFLQLFCISGLACTTPSVSPASKCRLSSPRGNSPSQAGVLNPIEKEVQRFFSSAGL